MQGHVVIFDGASSAGKSSVIKQLMPILGASYQVIAVDDFVTEVFLEQQKLKLSEKNFLERVNKQTDFMYAKIRSLVADGKNVILDTVLSGLEGEKSIQEQLEHLKNISKFLVLVHCPLPVLIDRIKQRNEKALKENKPDNVRSIGTALSQFGNLYQLQKTRDDVLLGMLSRGDVEYACEVAKNECGDDLNKFEQFKTWLFLQLNLHDKQDVSLTTRLKYDGIVDTSKLSSQECAQIIKKKLKG